MRWRWIAGGLAASALAVAAFNWFSAMSPLQAALSDDPRNKELSIWAYHRLGVLPGELVFDVRDLGPGNSANDVLRTLLQYARAQKDSSFEHVTLAYRGEARFQIDGRYFSKLGTEYGYQNPIYTLRTMPENLYRPSGRRAYESWTGGLLGVTARQMEDLSDFTGDWFMRAETRR